MFRLFFAICLALCFISSDSRASDTRRVSPRFLRLTNEQDTRIREAFDLLSFPKNRQTTISWKLMKNGEIFNPEITYSSGDVQVDLACLEAVLSSGPESELASFSMARNISFQRENCKHPSTRFGEVNFDGNYPIFLIPLSVATKYRELFERNELDTLSNLRILASANCPKEKLQKKIQRFYMRWTKFFLENPKASRELIKNEARRIEKECQLKSFPFS